MCILYTRQNKKKNKKEKKKPCKQSKNNLNQTLFIDFSKCIIKDIEHLSADADLTKAQKYAQNMKNPNQDKSYTAHERVLIKKTFILTVYA